MNIHYNPSRSQWEALTTRPALSVTELFETIRPIVNNVRQRGDDALLEYEARFDHVELNSLPLKSPNKREAMDG